VNDAARLVQLELLRPLVAGVVGPARVTVENLGTVPLRNAPELGGEVQLEIQWNRIAMDRRSLPVRSVAPGARVTFHIPLRAPDEPGSHELTLALMRSDGARLGAAPILLYREVVPISAESKTVTDELQSSAWRVNYWYFQPAHGISRSSTGEPYPRFFERANGCRLVDPDGNEYLDYMMGWGSAVLGYGEPRVRDAIVAALEGAPTAPLPHRLEIELAGILAEHIPCAEVTQFGKNGSDVCTVAMRLARLYTGKRHILCCGYHGWQDSFTEQRGFGQSGVPERESPLIHPFRFDDLEDFRRLHARYRHDLAAVMLEPAGPWTDLRAGPCGEPSPGFLAELAQAARDAGALLVFDEIITGYRYPELSYQKRSGVIPDLACFGKGLANGMPLAAVVGRREIFQRGLPGASYGPTFKGEVYSLAAAKAAIAIHRSEPVARHIHEHGTRLKQGIDDLCRKHGVAAAHKGPPYRGALVFDEPDPDRLTAKRTLYLQELARRHVLSMNGVMLPSYAHDEPALRQALAAIDSALEVVARAERDDAFDRLLEIPPLLG
jgi:glutamate-1-semialdehyde 2,1-aminomutase